MRRLFAAVLVLLASTACAAHERARWVPGLLLGARVARASDGGLANAWDWRVDGALRWELARASLDIERSEDAAPAPEPRCFGSALCAWERRQRARAYDEALRSLESREERP